jgi:hypothetical protein
VSILVKGETQRNNSRCKKRFWSPFYVFINCFFFYSRAMCYLSVYYDFVLSSDGEEVCILYICFMSVEGLHVQVDFNLK